MAIQVTCPGCLKRFSVSDKFAGKSGPCPNCQKQIKIPEKSDDVVIHAPKDDAPTDSKGRSILKPIRRTEVALSMPVILGASLTTLVVVGLAFGLGISGDVPPPIVLALSALILAVPLAYIGYWFLHDDELEAFRGKPLWMRCGVVALAFAASWAIYAYVPAYVAGYSSVAEMSAISMAMMVPIMLAIGATVSVAALELEVVQGALHYIFYFGVTFFLAWLSGAPLGEPLPGNVDLEAPPPASAPAEPGRPAAPPPATPPSSQPVPNLLQ